MKSPVDLKYITLAQIVGCGLVVLGHSFPFVTPYPPLFEKSIQYLYAFHMPLFVWCSGFLFAYTEQTNRKTLGDYTKQRTVKLLTPYFLLSLIGLVPKIMAASVLNDTLEMDTMQIIRAFLVPREGVWGHFWFLPMIYLLGIMGFILDKIACQRVWAWSMVCFVAFGFSFYKTDILQWFAINDVLQFLPFYSLGVLSSRWSFQTNQHGQFWLMSLVCVLGSLGLFVGVKGDHTIVHLRNSAIACLMIAALVNGCKRMAESISVNRKSPFAQTYQIFILSWPCQLVVGIVIERILHLDWMVFIPTVFVSGILMPLCILWLVDMIEKKSKTKILSFVLGR